LGNVLTTTKRDKIAAVNANIAQIAADAAGLPIPLAGDVGGFGYNLLETNAGIALDVQQSLQFTPTARGDLMFSAPVEPIINGITQRATRDIYFNYGDSVSFKTQSLSSISFTPVTSLSATLHNATDLVVGGDINIKALGLDIADVSVGPLIDKGLPSVDLGHIKLLDNTFSEYFGTTQGEPITLNFNCGPISYNPLPDNGQEDYRQVCPSSKYVDLGPVSSNYGIFQDFYALEECDAYRAKVDKYGNNLESPSCPNKSEKFDHFGAPYVNTPGGRVYLPSNDRFLFNPNNPTASTSDAEEVALLQSLGYSGKPSFDIPKGAPLESFAVPEPGTISGFGLAATLLLVSAWEKKIRKRKGALKL